MDQWQRLRIQDDATCTVTALWLGDKNTPETLKSSDLARWGRVALDKAFQGNSQQWISVKQGVFNEPFASWTNKWFLCVIDKNTTGHCQEHY